MSYEIISEESLNLSTSIENVLVVEESSSIEDVQVEGEGNRDKDEKLYVTLNSGDNGKSERVVRVKSSTPIFASDLNVDLMDELIQCCNYWECYRCDRQCKVVWESKP